MAASSGGKGGGHVPQGVDGRRQAPNRGLPQLQEAVGGGDHRSMVSPMSKSKEELEVSSWVPLSLGKLPHGVKKRQRRPLDIKERCPHPLFSLSMDCFKTWVHQQQVQQVVQGDERRYKSTTSTSHYRIRVVQILLKTF
ncbi:uncharacterized protein [Aegilops tauschii subsp. strangulata]|uniref:uncharacterized protein isoform X1 n=1 Tax=Aegilops tauschii subsp. strangulata TaxID=200361 RepID=UPI00098ABFCA|nr:uncharacterized protein LOC109768047 isoform X2 [Aegilops tauschii subsp. strangulata]XP_044331923.1 uncharacterized protein LOC123052686 isoform X2 [Triticum aestivum]